MSEFSPPEPLGTSLPSESAFSSDTATFTRRVSATSLGLYVAAFLISLDRAVFAPLLPALALDFHASIGAVGLAVSAYTIPYGLFQLGYGPIGDRQGKLTVIRWTFLFFAVGTGLCGLAATLTTLDVLRAFTGAVAAAIIPLALAFIGDVVPYNDRQQTITNLMGATSFGNALSAAFGGVIGQFMSWRALFGLYGVCGIIIAIALFRTASPSLPTAHRLSPVVNRQYGQLLQLRTAQVLYLLVGLEGIFVLGGFTYLGAYLSARFGISYMAIGFILACYGTGTLLMSRFVGRSVHRLGESRLILVGGVLQALGFLALLPLGWWPGYAVPMFVSGAGFAFFHSTLQTRATELVAGLRGTAVATFAFSLFLGGGIGTAVLGWLVTSRGYDPMLVLCGVGMLIVTAVAWRTW